MNYQLKEIWIMKGLSAGNMEMAFAVTGIDIVPYLFPAVNARITVLFLFLIPSRVKEAVTAAVIAGVVDIPGIKAFMGRHFFSIGRGHDAH
jgi:hypothetical protein